MTTTVKIKEKQFGAASSEITEEIAKRLYAKKGSTLLAIIEIKSEKTHEGLDGERQVDCAITSFEAVVDGDLNGQVSDTVRNLHRALKLNRSRISPAGDETLPIEDSNEPTVESVKAAAAALVETDHDGNVTGLWDGHHDEHEDLAGDESEQVDPYTYIHDPNGPAGADTACGLHATFGKNLHTSRVDDKVNCPECLSAHQTAPEDAASTEEQPAPA